METLLETVGAVIFILLAIIGLVSGFLAGAITGRNKLAFAILGLVGAVLAPVLLAVLGVGALAAGGVVAILLAGLIGAALLLMIGKLIFD